MENKEKQLFIKELERDLKIKISESKNQQQVFNALSDLKIISEKQKDEVMVILDKLQMFAEKQIAKEIEFYEEILLELQQAKDMETKGGVA